jgi:nucleoside-diphosphate-sugar epimerase
MPALNVIFGSGPLAKVTMRALLKRGKKVRLVNRSGNADVPTTVEVVGGDAYQPDFTRQVCEGAEVVYQCAQPGYTQWVTQFPPLQASILEGAASNRAKLIVGENLYMYGEVNGPIHEGLSNAAVTRKGIVRAQMAEALLNAHQTGKIQVAMARGADFYGPEVLSSSLGARAFIPALKGKTASLSGKLDIPHSYTYISDFGEAMAILGEREEALGQAWHVPNPPTLTQRELMEIFFAEIGRPSRMSGMGRLMLSIGGLFVPEAREMIEMLYEFEKPFIVDSSKFTKAFGYIATPHAAAMHDTAIWYREWIKKSGQ